MKAHPTAIIHPNAKLACSVTVGPYSLIGENVELGEDCEVMSHCVLEGNTRMGKGNRIFPWASVGLAPQDLKYHGESTLVEIGDDNTLREFITIHRATEAGDAVTRIGSHNLLMAYVPSRTIATWEATLLWPTGLRWPATSTFRITPP